MTSYTTPANEVIFDSQNHLKQESIVIVTIKIDTMA